MILFKREFVPLILSGRKTQTRRTWKRRMAKVGSIHEAKTGFAKDDVFARIRIISLRQEPLGNITEADAYAEGFDSVEQYRAVFEDIYGEWDAEAIVWVVDFELLVYKCVKCAREVPDWATVLCKQCYAQSAS